MKSLQNKMFFKGGIIKDAQIINGDFSQGTEGWNDIITSTIVGVDNVHWAVEGGQLKSIGSGTLSTYIFNTQTKPCNPTKNYRITFDIISGTGFGVRLSVTSSAENSGVFISDYLGVGSHSFDILAGTVQAGGIPYKYRFGFYRFGAHSGDYFIDNVNISLI